MEITTKHHDGDRSIKFASGRELRVPSAVVNACKTAQGDGQIRRIFMHTLSDWFVGGDGAMESVWEPEWNEHQMFGDYEPHVTVREYGEMLTAWNANYSRQIAYPSALAARWGNLNVRSLRPFTRFRQRVAGASRMGEVPVDTVKIGAVNERVSADDRPVTRTHWDSMTVVTAE